MFSRASAGCLGSFVGVDVGLNSLGVALRCVTLNHLRCGGIQVRESFGSRLRGECLYQKDFPDDAKAQV